MKEFINHPAVTRIFKTDIEVYGIKSITMDNDDNFKLVQYPNSLSLSPELYHDIHWVVLTAKYEDEAFREAYEESYTITAAIESRLNR